MELTQESVMITATVKTLCTGFFASSLHAFSEMLGHTASLTLVSLDLEAGTQKPKMSSKLTLALWGGEPRGPDCFNTVSFYVDANFGKPGAILVESHYAHEFYLKSITLQVPYIEPSDPLYFPCNTWICHTQLAHCSQPRILFANQVYRPDKTPKALLKLREDDLAATRGDGKGERRHGERIYDYDVYNDLSNPNIKHEDLIRPVLGGSPHYPYPRRCRTGRPHSISDFELEEPQLAFDKGYVPRDERFSDLKKDLFISAGMKSFCNYFLSAMGCLLCKDRSFEDIERINRLFVTDAPQFSGSKKPCRPITKFPKPGVIQGSKDAWRSDMEFGRQCLAGKNPVAIQRLQVFPPRSKLDSHIYGDSVSTITAHDLEPLLQGLSVAEAMDQNRLYILDYHDSFLPFINRINKQEGKLYASRTILYLTKERVLLPIAIELTLPPEDEGQKAKSRVFTADAVPCQSYSLWTLAKAHVAIADCGYHQLVSHWLRTHACIEPIIIATRRQLSTMHPLHVLLSPHFKDTLHINSLAKTSLINAGGKIEKHYSAGRYCLEISSAAYKQWRLDEESLPKDLIKRGMAVEDPSAKHGVSLLVEDYPFAVDGLDLWAAIHEWVKDYLTLYYEGDQALQEDEEVRNWWNEVREVGHADHALADWWVSMKRLDELVEVVTTLIWLTSAYHAAVNFGQYAYGAYMPNSPCMSRRLIPEEGTAEYSEMASNPQQFFLEMVPPQGATALAIAVLELLAQHLDEEEYLGERIDPQWTCDTRALAAFHNFRENLKKVEAGIKMRNASSCLRHRQGEVQLPYTLLVPSSSTPGLTFRGVPNSISM